MVEYASTFLMSVCTMPIDAAKIAVSVPMTATASWASGARLKIRCERATMYTPAVTMVAA